MGKLFKLDIITADNNSIEEDVVSLITNTTEGKIEFLANHIEAIASMVPTVTVIKKENGEQKKIFTSSGVAYFKDNTLKIACDSINTSEEIDISRAEEAVQRANNRLKSDENIDMERAKLALARAMSRLELKK